MSVSGALAAEEGVVVGVAWSRCWEIREVVFILENVPL